LRDLRGSIVEATAGAFSRVRIVVWNEIARMG